MKSQKPSKQYFYGVKIDDFAVCEHFAVKIPKENVFRKRVILKNQRYESKVQSLSDKNFVTNSGSRGISMKISQRTSEKLASTLVSY